MCEKIYNIENEMSSNIKSATTYNKIKIIDS